MTKGIHKKDDDAEMLAGVPASSLARRAGQTVILEFQSRRRHHRDLEDASSPVEGFEPIGLLAVRLVASWSRPRINCCRSAAWEEEGAPTGAEGLPVREG